MDVLMNQSGMEEKSAGGKRQAGGTRKVKRIVAGTLALIVILGIVFSEGILFELRTSKTGELAGEIDMGQSGEGSYLQVDHIQKVHQALNDGDNKIALQEIGICLEYLPEGDVLHEDLLVKQGCLMILEEDYSGAKKAFAKVNELYPGNTQGWLLNAQLHLDIGEPDKALLCMKRYMSLTPEDRDMAMMTAQLAFQQEDYHTASAHYEKLRAGLSEDEPKWAELSFNLGIIQLQQSAHNEALNYFNDARNAGTLISDIDYYCGLCRMSLGDYEQAVLEFSSAIEKGSFLQRSHYSRAVAGLLTQSPDEAMALADLQFAADYTGEDADPEISAQIEDILALYRAEEPDGIT